MSCYQNQGKCPLRINYSTSQRTRIKICGITREEDLQQAALLGADAVGFVFYPKSKRYVSPTEAGKLSGKAPAFLSTVALFVDPTDDEVETVIAIVSPSLLQFHGDESPDQCASYGLPYIKAFRVGGPGMDNPERLTEACLSHPHAAGWLFDTYTPAYGGSGESFDHTLLNGVRNLGDRARPLILSGGLKPDSVAEALTRFKPWAVDVSSGVEDKPGVKSASKMEAFIHAVNQVNTA